MHRDLTCISVFGLSLLLAGSASPALGAAAASQHIEKATIHMTAKRDEFR